MSRRSIRPVRPVRPADPLGQLEVELHLMRRVRGSLSTLAALVEPRFAGDEARTITPVATEDIHGLLCVLRDDMQARLDALEGLVPPLMAMRRAAMAA